MSNSAQMIVALFAGAGVGLFFGEMVSWMGVIGNGVILLMQMTVFPYIVVSLVGGIGSLSSEVASLLFRRAGIVMVSLWALGLVVVFLMPAAFPETESASFFSTSSVEALPAIDYYKLYIPANPFEAMAAGYVPAMVLFSIAMGLALVGMQGESKEQVIAFMSTTTEVFSRITRGLIQVLPLGIFGMSASAAGTMGVKEFANLQVYLIAMIALASLLTFWILPWVIASLTPVSFRDALRISRASVVTAFATGNVFIVIPVIVEECKAIFAERDGLDDDAEIMIDVLVPIAYSFPNIGKLTVILFVVFAGWFTGHPIDPSQVPGLAISGLLSLFGSVYAAIPFMLDLVQLPTDVFQLFVMSGFITGKFSSMAAVLNLFALTLVSVALFRGSFKKGAGSWIRLGVGVSLGAILVIGATRAGLELLVDDEGKTSEVIANMRVGEEVPHRVSRTFPVEGETPTRRLADVEEIKRRGVLRVGYQPSNVPFSYYNNAAELVGFDIEMVTRLALDLEVAVEFVPFRRNELALGLDQGFFDVAASGIAVNIEVMQTVNYTIPVVSLNRCLVVADHRVKEFATTEDLFAHEPFTMAYVDHDDVVERARGNFPNVTFEEIDGYRKFFKQEPGTYDSLLTSAQAGSAWTLFFPEYGVAAINRDHSFPTAWAIAQDNPRLLRFVDNWLQLQQVNGEQQRVSDYWILGQGAEKVGKRWSIIRDVLGWVD